jgi:hypothetical protein
MMREKNNRLDSLLAWAKSTYGVEISQRIARESPREEADFWIALNKVRATHNQKYQNMLSAGKSSMSC